MSREFVRRAVFDTDDLVGARWWNESFAAFHGPLGNMLAGSPLARRALVTGALGLVPKLMIGGVSLAVVAAAVRSCSDDDEVGSSLDAIELQRQQGWNVGQPGAPLPLAGQLLDVDGGATWGNVFASLSEVLAPEWRLRPYAVPTLFQSLAEPGNHTLRAVMRPVHPPNGDQIFARGQALRALAEQRDAPEDLALVIDLPGPDAVALAAALAPRFAPVFTFDNWPHPAGVVPSHVTLGASLYYLPRFIEAARTRPQPSRPMFVLDANRLSPYRDDANQFDNRYVAPLPSAGALAGLGVKRILYVRPNANNVVELDDLNADFVAWQEAGIRVRTLPLDDFSTDLTTASTAVDPAHAAPAAPQTVHHYYGGHPYHHTLFWHHYGYNVGTAPTPRRALNAPPPARLSNAVIYRPTFRPTVFATRAVGGVGGVGKQKPSGFGRVSFRTDTVGRFVGTGSRRSGSFSRSRSSSWG